MSQTPAVQICLSGDEVDALIFALEHSHTWAWDTTPEHVTTRTRLLERLRAQVAPVCDWTAAEIQKREG